MASYSYSAIVQLQSASSTVMAEAQHDSRVSSSSSWSPSSSSTVTGLHIRRRLKMAVWDGSSTVTGLHIRSSLMGTPSQSLGAVEDLLDSDSTVASDSAIESFDSKGEQDSAQTAKSARRRSTSASSASSGGGRDSTQNVGDAPSTKSAKSVTMIENDMFSLVGEGEDLCDTGSQKKSKGRQEIQSKSRLPFRRRSVSHSYRYPSVNQSDANDGSSQRARSAGPGRKQRKSWRAYAVSSFASEPEIKLCREYAVSSFASDSGPKRRKSWREFAGRSYGNEGYQIGDIARGVAHALVSSTASSAPITLEDLEPITSAGKACDSGMCSSSPRASGESWLRSLRPSRTPSFASVSGCLGLPESSILGEGQYGMVWRARSRVTKKIYAVKTIKNGLKDEAMTSREIQAAQYVRDEPHPCLVQLFAIFSDDCPVSCSLVMEFCIGGDMYAKISEARSMACIQDQSYSPSAQAPKWLAQIFLGLEHVHLQIEMLFRDLKPANIVFDSNSCAKITDFGLSRSGLKSSGAWTFGFPSGSPGYTAPEISEQEMYDHRADLYSFGVLIWVLLTGGLTDRDEPMPPVNGIEDEWVLLAECLDDPENHHAQALHEPALDLVRQLTSRSPSARLQHKGIREHAFFRTQEMPPPIGRNGVDLESSATSLGSSPSSGACIPAREMVLEWLRRSSAEAA